MDVTSQSIVNMARLERDLSPLRATFENAAPFRHVVIDDFLEPSFAAELYDSYPSLDFVQLSIARMFNARSYDGEVERFGKPFSEYFAALAAQPFLSWLRRLTDVPDAEMDPKLVGGGLHQGARGSDLPVHADHNTHPDNAAWYRRVNILFYVNAGWKPEWGGELELYDATGSRMVKKVLPAFNRALIMDVHDTAFHGYRQLAIPSNVTRKMLASYFYSSFPSAQQTAASHPTLVGAKATQGKMKMVSERGRRWLLHRLSDFGGLKPRPRPKAELRQGPDRSA